MKLRIPRRIKQAAWWLVRPFWEGHLPMLVGSILAAIVFTVLGLQPKYERILVLVNCIKNYGSLGCPYEQPKNPSLGSAEVRMSAEVDTSSPRVPIKPEPSPEPKASHPAPSTPIDERPKVTADKPQKSDTPPSPPLPIARDAAPVWPPPIEKPTVTRERTSVFVNANHRNIEDTLSQILANHQVAQSPSRDAATLCLDGKFEKLESVVGLQVRISVQLKNRSNQVIGRWDNDPSQASAPGNVSEQEQLHYLLRGALATGRQALEEMIKTTIPPNSAGHPIKPGRSSSK